MVLLLTPSPSNHSTATIDDALSMDASGDHHRWQQKSSSHRSCASQAADNKQLTIATQPPLVIIESSNNLFGSSPYHSQLRFNDGETECVDDEFSDSSSIHSDSSDMSFMYSMFNDSDSLNSRRRRMLDVSISKIQTMNASNVAISLRKSLLIFNTMKCLQRELDGCCDDLCGSLVEESKEAVTDDDLPAFEFEMRADASETEHCKSVCEQGMVGDETATTGCTRANDVWSWGNDESLGYEAANNNKLHVYDTVDSDLFSSSSSDSYAPVRATSTGIAHHLEIPSACGNAWSGASDAFMDDYLEMWGVWDDVNYNPLTNCNLTQAELMNMFRFPAAVCNHQQLLSQA